MDLAVLRSALACLAPALCLACCTPALRPDAVPAPAAPTAGAPATDYVLVFLKTGPGRPEGEARQRALEGHFSNMGRMAEQGVLLVAGPLGEPRIDPDHRGIFLFDVPTVEEALEHGRTDPAVQAEVFVLEAVPLRSRWPLRSLPARERAAQEDGTAGMRAYVLATAEDAEAADRALEPLVAEGRVAFTARLGGERAGSGFYALEVDTVDEARFLVETVSGDVDPGWALFPWYGSRLVGELEPPDGAG